MILYEWHNELIHKIDDLINNKLDVNHLYTKDSVAKILILSRQL